MNIEAVTEYEIQTLDVGRLGWQSWKEVPSKEEGLAQIAHDPNARLVERTKVVIHGEWAEVIE